MRLLRNVVFAVIAAMGLALPALAADRAIIVLDGSGSMWAQIDGKARITVARETLTSVLSNLPEDLELGLMTYGNREKGNCADIQMLVEPGAGTAVAITEAADAINPKGMTPLSDAVRLAAEDLRFTEEKATVILITDGLETCAVDPCALGNELDSQGIDFTVHVLGFGLSDEEGEQVACLAENTGGKYLSAKDGDSLVKALTETVDEVTQAEPEPEPEPKPAPIADYNLKPTASLSEGGPDIVDENADLAWTWYTVGADGGQGDYVAMDYNSRFKGTLEPGDYIMTATMGYAVASQKVTISAGAIAEPHFVLNGAILNIHPLPSEGADVDTGASVEIQANGNYVTTNYGNIHMVVPAGALEVKVTIGEATVTRSYDVAAGETIDEDVVVGVGLAKVTSFYIEGSPIKDDIFVEIVEAKKVLDGTRKSIAYKYGGDVSFELPPGDYVATYTLDGTKGETPFTVKTAELTEVPLILNAGVLVISVPADDFIELVSAKADIAGNRKSFINGYGPKMTTTLAAGDYLILSLDKETPITIVGGERSEVTIALTGKSK